MMSGKIFEVLMSAYEMPRYAPFLLGLAADSVAVVEVMVGVAKMFSFLGEACNFDCHASGTFLSCWGIFPSPCWAFQPKSQGLLCSGSVPYI